MQLTGDTRNISKRCKLLPAVLQIDHTQHVLDAAKSICLPDDQLDLAVGCFDPCVAPVKPYGVQSMAKDCCINIRDKRKTVYALLQIHYPLSSMLMANAGHMYFTVTLNVLIRRTESRSPMK